MLCPLFPWLSWFLVYVNVCQSDARLLRRQSPSSSPTCPPGSTIVPCTCTVNTSTLNGLPELSCIQADPSGTSIDLDGVLSRLSVHLDSQTQSKLYARLRLVNTAISSLNQSMLHSMQFNYVDIHENNLTQIEPDTFVQMRDSLLYLRIQASQLKSVFGSLRSLRNLTTLVLNLGVDSVQNIPSGALNELPNLRQVVISGVVNSISSSAFVSLPSLQSVRILNQLRSVASNAFELNQPTSVNQSIQIDLSNNQLNETSFTTAFFAQHPNTSITLDLTFNWVRYLPESVFRPFFEANPNNRLLLNNNKFECGRCDSFWLVNDTRIESSQFSANCYMDREWNLWDYDWSICERSNDPISGAITLHSGVSLLILFTAGISIFFVIF